MLGCDYKIFAKILTNRMQSIILDIIHNEQKGFQKGKNIADNLMELLTIVAYCKQFDQKYIIMAFDFEKAFDKVRWSALRKVMEN